MSETSAAPEHVTCAIEDGVAVVTIDDGKANALSHAVLAGIETALDDALAGEASAVVIEGRDGKFSAGFDLSVMTSGPTQARELLGRGAELGLRLYELPVPVVFAVTGHALAMGGILQCCADLRVGASGPYKLGLPEVRIGMPVPGFAVELCRDRLSPRWFTRVVQLGEGLSPEQALAAGLLDEVVELDQVRPRARELAAELAEGVHAGPFRLTRTIVRGDLAARLREVLAEDLSAFFVAEG
jgi:enoyl-CoA hydratase